MGRHSAEWQENDPGIEKGMFDDYTQKEKLQYSIAAGQKTNFLPAPREVADMRLAFKKVNCDVNNDPRKRASEMCGFDPCCWCPDNWFDNYTWDSADHCFTMLAPSEHGHRLCDCVRCFKTTATPQVPIWPCCGPCSDPLYHNINRCPCGCNNALYWCMRVIEGTFFPCFVYAQMGKYHLRGGAMRNDGTDFTGCCCYLPCCCMGFPCFPGCTRAYVLHGVEATSTMDITLLAKPTMCCWVKQLFCVSHICIGIWTHILCFPCAVNQEFRESYIARRAPTDFLARAKLATQDINTEDALSARAWAAKKAADLRGWGEERVHDIGDGISAGVDYVSENVTMENAGRKLHGASDYVRDQWNQLPTWAEMRQGVNKALGMEEEEEDSFHTARSRNSGSVDSMAL